MKSIFCFLTIFCIHVNLPASTNSKSIFPLHSSGSLKFDVDVCQMDGAADSTRIEIIYSVFLTKQNSVSSAEEDITTLSIDLGIHNKSGQLLAKISENKSVSLFDSLNQNSYTTFMDIKKLSLMPDTITLDLQIQESLMGLKGEVSQSFLARPFKKEFSLSDLYFASYAQRAGENSVFNKGGLMLVPNPSRLFFVNGATPRIFAYYEINNLTYDVNKASFYEVNTVVQDMAGKQMFNDPRKQIKVTSENTSRIKVVPISELNNGVYHLTVDVLDIASGLQQEVDGYFKVDRGGTRGANLLPMSEDEAQKYFDQIKYIATDQEKDIYSKLDPRGKQEFLLHFWKSRDPDPGTPENEFMIEHFRRLDEAEQRFKGGSSSDMGRVYIMYGPPADIERENLMIIGAQSVETWIYTLNGRSDFVFIDRDGDGKYTLIHSTHRDENYNPNWKDQISTWVDQ
jgi:GWxTD domain-containing protein